MNASTPAAGIPALLRTCLILGLLSATGILRAELSIYAYSPDVNRLGQWAPGSQLYIRLQNPPGAEAHLQWYHDDQPIAGATSSQFIHDSVTPADAGNYRIRRTDPGWEEFSNTATVNVVAAAPSIVDPTFVARYPSAVGDVSTPEVVGCTADGRIYLTANQYLFRLLADGSADPDFTPRAAVPVAGVFADGRLLLAQAPYLLDADGSAGSLTLPPELDPGSPLAATAIQPDGKVLFAQQTPRLVLARLNADLSPDPTFAYTAPTGPTVWSLAVNVAGKIYVGGSVPAMANDGRVITLPWADRLLPDGSRDPAFHWSFSATALFGHPFWAAVYPLSGDQFLSYAVYDSQFSFTLVRPDGPDIRTSVLPPANGILADSVRDRIFYFQQQLHRYVVTAAGLVDDPAPLPQSPSGRLTLTPDGRILMPYAGSSFGGHPSPGLVRLLPTGPATTPIAAIGATPFAPVAGTTVTLSVRVSGTPPFTYQWLALDGQIMPSDTTSAELIIPSISRANLGRYQVRVTGPGGQVLSDVYELVPSWVGQPYLANLSGRAVPGTGENTTIAGVVTQSPYDPLMPLLVRGAGPALASLGVTSVLPDPVIELYDRSGAQIARNDDWGDDARLSDAFSVTGAFPFPAGSHDSAILRDFTPGIMTVMLKSAVDDRTGVGLVEIYRADTGGGGFDGSRKLINLSLRARTGLGENTAVAGFVAVDQSGLKRPLRLLLRAVGPTLSTQGIAHPLANPVLTLFDRTGNVIATNDDWAANKQIADVATLVGTMARVGAFSLPTDSKDAALLVDLPPGAYTMHATGGEGVVLLEIYLVP